MWVLHKKSAIVVPTLWETLLLNIFFYWKRFGKEALVMPNTVAAFTFTSTDNHHACALDSMRSDCTLRGGKAGPSQ